MEDILNISSKNAYLPNTNFPILRSLYPSVETWLSLIKNSYYVITDSFHGMVFSIIFERNFIVIVNKKRGVARFTSLLEKLGLEDRIVTNTEDVEIISKCPIDYSAVNKKINILKQNSLFFLYNNAKQ